jgi:hypothetical protein
LGTTEQPSSSARRPINCRAWMRRQRPTR